MSISKNDTTKVWAENGIKNNPGATKIDKGWISEKPSFQKVNYIENKQDHALKYLDENGIGEYTDITNYAKGGLATGSDDNIYQAKVEHDPNNAEDPINENSDWGVIQLNGDYDDSGSANNYLLTATGAAAIVPYNGMRASFIPVNENTGASLVQFQDFAPSLGGQDIVRINGTSLAGGELSPNLEARIRYDKSNDRWVLLNIGDTTPVGSEIWARTNSIVGWLYANGLTYNREDFQTLYDTIVSIGQTIDEATWSTGTVNRTLYSEGNGTTTFRVPDIRGLCIHAVDDGRGFDTGGRTVGQTTRASIDENLVGDININPKESNVSQMSLPTGVFSFTPNGGTGVGQADTSGGGTQDLFGFNAANTVNVANRTQSDNVVYYRMIKT